MKCYVYIMVIVQTCVRSVATVWTDVGSVGTVWTYVHVVGTMWTCVHLVSYCVDLYPHSSSVTTMRTDFAGS